MAKKQDTASVLAFEKKLVPSDGYYYGTNWDERSKYTPLKLQEKSVRGTISNRFNKKDVAVFNKDPLKLDAKVEKPNLQTVDACSLGMEQDTLKHHFTLKVLGGITTASACNNAVFHQSYKQAAQTYIDEQGFSELARRYALNIANARYLWRNRVGAEQIEVQVNVLNKGKEKSWTFDAIQFSTRNFDIETSAVEQLAALIAEVLSSKNDFLLLEITTYAQLGKAQEVYPSEELVLDKGKGKKSKILYAVDDIAAMHSQKVGNALRTIDTWYPAFDTEESAGPIAIEPYGAVTNLGTAFRTPKDKQDFYTFFDKWARGEKLQRIEDEHYVMATLVRGGVFGESDK
jgi:CRISPR-associated protein Csy3